MSIIHIYHIKWLIFLLIIIIIKLTSGVVTININTEKYLAKISSSYLGFTIDWWTDRGIYGKEWGKSSILFIDFSNKLLNTLINGLTISPTSLKVGGIPQDVIIYDIDDPPECPSNGPYPNYICLSVQRIDEICSFFKYTGLDVTWGLNGLYGRDKISSNIMNFTNVKSFIKHLHRINCPISSFSLGYEYGVSPNPDTWIVDIQSYSTDIIKLRSLIDSLYKKHRPLVIAPDNVPYLEYLTPFLEISRKYIDKLSIHGHFCNSSSPNAKFNLTNPLDMNKFQDFIYSSYSVFKSSSIDPLPIITEVSPSTISGVSNFNNRYIDIIWYLDYLGWAASSGFDKVYRISLIGGDYELIDHNSFKPNPSYFIALLWQKLIGTTSLFVTRLIRDNLQSYVSQRLRTYGMCPKDIMGNGILLIAINTDEYNSQDIDFILSDHIARFFIFFLCFRSISVWLLKSFDEDNPKTSLFSKIMTENGWDKLDINGYSIPDIEPVVYFDPNTIVTLPPLSVAFVLLKTTSEIYGCKSYKLSLSEKIWYSIVAIIGFIVLCLILYKIYIYYKTKRRLLLDDIEFKSEYRAIS